MKTLFLILFIAVSVIQTTAAAKNEVVVLRATEGRTEFLVIGKPKMIKINGEGQGPSGALSASKNSLSGIVKVDLTTLTTKNDLRDNHMKNKYLEVSKYPEATLEIINLQLPKDFSALSGQKTEVPFTGKFTMHGKTSAVAGKAYLSRIAKHVVGSAEFVFKITDHLDTLPSVMGVRVAENVTVNVHLKGLVQSDVAE